jgi:hypothetical protein
MAHMHDLAHGMVGIRSGEVNEAVTHFSKAVQRNLPAAASF